MIRKYFFTFGGQAIYVSIREVGTKQILRLNILLE